MGVRDWLLDRSVYYSFDRSGYLRHARRFDPADLDRSLRGQVCLVTGANSGLGFEVAGGLAARGATVHMLCRDEARGEAARQTLLARHPEGELRLHVVDLSRLASVRAFLADFAEERVDVLVHNAGVLPPAREITEDGLELTVATHLVGPFLLTQGLRARLGGGRVLFVSSGGMYAKRLHVARMMANEGPYDGVAAYAMTKRGQVVLSELLAQELAPQATTVNAMHPGWAATPGVERSLPGFWQRMRERLRSPAEGADTVLWLAVATRVDGETGRFWFDRAPVPTHLSPLTRERAAQRPALWELCRSRSLVP